MELTRRGFLKLSGVGVGAAALAGLGFEVSAVAAGEPLRISSATEVTTVCSYCAVGCSAIVSVVDGKAVALEGLADSAINRGAMCPKGLSMRQYPTSEFRLKKPMVREPYAKEWKEIEWDEALDGIARLIKDTRDADFITKDDKGVTVNRCETIAQLGCTQLNTEEISLYTKMARSLGIVYFEHQARI